MPFTSILPPDNSPLAVIVIGNLWSFVVPDISTPIDFNASTRAVLGLFLSVPFPVIVNFPFPQGITVSMNLRSVPDSLTFIEPLCIDGFLLNPIISKWSAYLRIVAPKDRQALMVASVSSENKGFTILVPPFILPIIIAL
ncbi:MAG: hypothetical protein AUJ85_10670 [Elusimicrobia bacterium CG1_02_37_114]|nr:MAG: hypothetical protein AUJ85_10670 [Elusimicrobia bacterium CG1_02_37_114]